jgi:hypothetical protein
MLRATDQKVTPAATCLAVLALIAMLACGSPGETPPAGTPTTTLPGGTSAAAAPMAGAAAPSPPVARADGNAIALPRSVADVANAPWCTARGGCGLKDARRIMSGGMNYTFAVGADARGSFELQVRDTVLTGAGLLLYGGASESVGAKAERALHDFTRQIVGECAAAAGEIARHASRTVLRVMDAPPVRCGRWDVRTGTISGGNVYVSIDQAPSA